MTDKTNAWVVAVCAAATHSFSKQARSSITLIEGLGVEGDAHAGKTVQHLSRIAINPETPNIRQVHLVHGELLDELAQQGFELAPGEMGENMVTRGINLLGLPTGTRLAFGPGPNAAEIELTGLRNPCKQLNTLRPGLMYELVHKAADGAIVRKGGVMAIVTKGGPVAVNAQIQITLPAQPHTPLQPV